MNKKKVIKHIDLFSGIGGFALATEMVWKDVEHIFIDSDEFCQEILKKHWPNAKIYGDIKRFSKKQFTSDTRGEKSNRLHKQPRKKSTQIGFADILTGGFPCQPFSQVGSRKGTEDDRHLWPEMFRIIREFKPAWVIAENVRGLVTWNDGLVLEQVCADLESENYKVQPFIIPAIAVNAPHRRDRVWIVANKYGSRFQKTRAKQQTTRSRGKSSSEWERDWIEVATEFCRVDDGLPKRMDRNSRLKALGNAIVPQVAAEIMRGINFM